jgi:hypothetical protein
MLAWSVRELGGNLYVNVRRQEVSIEIICFHQEMFVSLIRVRSHTLERSDYLKRT